MAGPIRISILANGRQARAEIERTAASADLIGKSFSRAGKLVGGLFAADALARGAAAIVRTGGDYVETLNKIQAITGSSQKAIDAGASSLEAQAGQYAKMGETGNDAADGVLELTKAGLSLNKSLKAVYPTMVLAKSGQLEVADASTLVSNTLNTFSLKAKDAGDIANYLANAADASSADVADLAESFKYVAPLAAKSGVSLADTNAILAELANSGVKASQAGTGFRKFLASLQAPVGKAADAIDGLGLQIYDSSGRMRPLVDIIFDLKKGLANLDQEGQNQALRQIFGLTGITSAQIILKNGAAGLGKYREQVLRADGAARLANASSKGLLGTVHSLTAEAITTADALYRKYSPAVDQALRQVVASAKKELPSALAKAKSVLRQAEPTLESLAHTAIDLGGDVKELATGPLGHDLVKALKLANGLTKTASDLLGDLPDPIKKIGIEALIASRYVPRLTAGLDRIGTSAKGQIASLSRLRSEISTTQFSLKKVALTPGQVVPDFSGIVTPQVAALQKQYQGMKLVETQSISTKAALGKLSQASRGAAGIAGFTLLADGAQRTDGVLKDLENTAGGAAAGFAVGGPWGAAIGGAAGLVATLGTSLGKTRSNAEKAYAEISNVSPTKQAAKALEDLKSTLDQVTGAYTGATRAAVLQKLQTGGLVDVAAKYGITSRQLVSAALGQKGALAQLSPVLIDYQGQLATVDDKIKAVTASNASYVTASSGGHVVGRALTQDALAQVTALEKQKKAIQTNVAELQQLPGALRSDAQELRANAAATADYTGKLKGIPSDVRSRIEAQGILPTTRDVAIYASQIKGLDKKQIRTLISASGAESTVKQVQKVIDKIKAVNQTKVNPDISSGISKGLFDAEGIASKGGRQIADNVKKNADKAKTTMPELAPSVRQATDGARGPASAGGVGIGSSVKAGFGTGFAGAVLAWSAQLRAAVNAAIAAGRAAAKAHSPSEETARLGEDLADGLAVGMARRKHKTHEAGRDVITAALAGILAGTTSGSDDIQGALDALSDRLDKDLDRTLKQIQARFDKKEKKLRAQLKGAAETRAVNANDRAEDQAEKAAKKQRKAINKLTKEYRNQLRAVGAQQDIVNKQLEDAKGNLQQLVDTAQAYADSIRDAVVASGSLSSLGEGAGFSSIDDLIAQRTAKLADAKRFADDINALIAAGLNANDIKDLIAQGVEGGLGTADALLAAGPGAIAKMNDLSAQLQATGVALGANVSNSLYGAGIQAAQGLVDGLTAQSDALAASATKLARALVRAVKKALGIKSPSRVFKNIAHQTTAGLVKGLSADQIHVKRQGQSLADSLQRGFGTPALTTYLAADGGASSQSFTGSLRLTSSEMDALSRGRAILADIDVAKAVGVRSRAV